MRIKCPITNAKARGKTLRYQYDLLVCLRNETRSKYFSKKKAIINIRNELSAVLSDNNITKIETITNKARKNMFCVSKQRLVKKFDSLRNIKLQTIVMPKTSH